MLVVLIVVGDDNLGLNLWVLNLVNGHVKFMLGVDELIKARVVSIVVVVDDVVIVDYNLGLKLRVLNLAIDDLICCCGSGRGYVCRF